MIIDVHSIILHLKW